jgi:hypothetical protein
LLQRNGSSGRTRTYNPPVNRLMQVCYLVGSTCLLVGLDTRFYRVFGAKLFSNCSVTDVFFNGLHPSDQTTPIGRPPLFPSEPMCHSSPARIAHYDRSGLMHARSDQRDYFVMSKFCAFFKFHFLNPLMRTTSLIVTPREKRVGLPSRERSNHAICFGSEIGQLFWCTAV